MEFNIDKYDGNLLHGRFAYKFFKDKVLPIGNILCFRAPMEVLADGMIDQEDIDKQEFIWSDDAINFLWEIPILDNPLGAVAYQRLLNTHIANILGSVKYLDCPVIMDGDDIMVQKEHNQGGIVQQEGKASVSITYVKDGVALGHTAINITAGKKAPAFAFSTNFDDDQANQFMSDVQKTFYELNDDMFVATSKVIIK
tara:strand:+ start:10027 stop:10620 length:594 start_codon:yes stop_codon:yes gene_type:complete